MIPALAYIPDDPEHRFTGFPLVVAYIDGVRWLVIQELSYLLQDGRISTIHVDFPTDFASIPRALWNIYPPAGNGKDRYGVAALWHDWLCEHRQIEGMPCTSREAVDLFREIMEYIGVDGVTVRTMYWSVRLFGPQW
jgi:hypothetical protein